MHLHNECHLHSWRLATSVGKVKAGLRGGRRGVGGERREDFFSPHPTRIPAPRHPRPKCSFFFLFWPFPPIFSPPSMPSCLSLPRDAHKSQRRMGRGEAKRILFPLPPFSPPLISPSNSILAPVPRRPRARGAAAPLPPLPAGACVLKR